MSARGWDGCVPPARSSIWGCYREVMAEDFLASALAAEASSRAPHDPDYPLFHVAPPVGRLNDPNGLIEVGGTYHAFFQYTPEHPRKLVYWGHATSRDLTRWDYHAPAILPDTHQDANGAYSGTAIEVGDHVELWYTGNYKDAETGEREATQCVVTSTDMEHFKKQVPPVIARQPEGYTAHFRDPQVWRDVDGSYRMLLGVQRENLPGAALLYRSSDLRTWECEGEMTFPDADSAFDAFGYMWECPNLVRLVDEETDEARDVLIICAQGISPEREGFENVFPCIAIVGELVGTELRGADGSFEELDRGTEFYAPQVMARSASSDPGAPTLLFGWAGNAGEDDQPSIETGGWVHCFTAPRALTLRGGRVIARPYLPGLPLAPATLEGTPTDEAGTRVVELEGSRSWRLAFDASYEGALSVRIGSDSGLSITLEEGRLTVDLTGTRYPHGGRRIVTLDAGEASRVEILHDRSITEIYLGDGSRVFTTRSFLRGDGTGVTLSGAASVTNVSAVRAD